MKKIFLSLLIISPLLLQGQSVFAPLNSEYSHMVDRYEIRYGRPAESFHSGAKPYLRKAVVGLTDSLLALDKKRKVTLSEQDQFNLQYLRDDSWEWTTRPKESDSRSSFMNTFYLKKADFYHFQNKDFEIHASPVVYVGLGKENNGEKTTFINTRGLEIRGMITKKLGFYSYFADNQAQFASYVRSRIASQEAVPQEGFYKPFKENATTGENKGVDFLSARGYIDFQAVKFVNIQFGHDRNFIGNGYRSLILSDYSSPYLFLKLTTQIGKFQYQNLFTEINDQQGQKGLPYGTLGPKKFFAYHRLSLNVSDKLNIGISETEVHGRSKDQGYFDLQYLNPIIFYRAIEQQRNSSDNAMIALDYRYTAAKKIQLYGQFLLDEFVLSAVKSGNGNWVNKFGVQVGGKYIDAFGISNLDLQGEYNVVKPYTYQHLTTSTNYIHYNQSLAHPLGANFNEMIGIVRYQPVNRLFLRGLLMVAKYGTDASAVENWGGDPKKFYNTRKLDLGNVVGQGVANNLTYAELTASYMLKHNVFIDLTAISRKLDSSNNTLDKSLTYLSAAVRWNIGQRQMVF